MCISSNLPIIPNIIVPSFGAAVLYLSGRPFDTSSVLIFSICLGIAIDDTIYFLTNLKNEMRSKNLEDAIGSVLEHAGKTLSYTTFILVFVFGLFYAGSFIPNQSFAIATSIILSTALFLDLTFLPSLIILINKTSLGKKKLTTLSA